jgi:hypothetical protein
MVWIYLYVQYGFNHTVVNTNGTNTHNTDGSLKQDNTEEFGPDVPANGYGERSGWQGVSVANLTDDIDYDITAYTRASLFDGNDFLGDGEVRATDVRFMKAP